MNHRLTPDFFDERLSYYQGFLDGARISSSALPDLRAFTENRSDYVRADLRRVLGLDEAVPCSVRGPEGREVLIDGHLEALPYEGWYFAGQEIALASADSDRGPVTWRVEGEAAVQGPCRIPVRGPTVITALIE